MWRTTGLAVLEHTGIKRQGQIVSGTLYCEGYRWDPLGTDDSPKNDGCGKRETVVAKRGLSVEEVYLCYKPPNSLTTYQNPVSWRLTSVGIDLLIHSFFLQSRNVQWSTPCTRYYSQHTIKNNTLLNYFLSNTTSSMTGLYSMYFFAFRVLNKQIY